MPRSFDLSADFQESVEEVHRAFGEEGYWRARLADIPVDEAKLESLRVGGESGSDGTIEVVTLQVVRSHNLAALVKQLHRGDLCVRRTETWGPLTDGAATASIAGSIVDTPVSVAGTGELSPIAGSGGARLAFRISVQVRVPIIGGKVERLIGTHLAELVTREQRLTADWIADNDS
ncbi:DUF2505 domain-containing protein [Mycobacterium heidelbergense]|uniref:Uncharacterized protein n=1 Tax=Mycobacterium heidelbergense TaxID=53376 RepID=A0A1X0DKM8_MYCHE|nr:DUF2505 domain-containing protein [Mycobacterium heidelbergense]MCV7050278.1 DUF2505 domain-containing protein [Mycobacterium heidelbergense]ORA72944.1 hypothetical protein BST25_13170 [Mycobacterium heidelbergense]BBZ49638.1 hypothetical protein MHEI_13550 [Mycobacterium heidelbergense]